jgi:phosphatidylserine/phosphatidylglycerophosphate/cardiolipin synthase-like enzyme
MKTATILILIQVLLIVLAMISHANAQPPVKPYFRWSPYGAVAQTLKSEIDAAQTSIYIMMYAMTSDTLITALNAAKLRGVTLEIIADASQFSKSKLLKSVYVYNNWNIVLDRGESIMHYKLAIIDMKTIILGSYNWTERAEYSNAEVIYVLDDVVGAADNYNMFLWHKGHSSPPPSEMKKVAPVYVNLWDPLRRSVVVAHPFERMSSAPPAITTQPTRPKSRPIKLLPDRPKTNPTFARRPAHPR